jgi:hypothetical protein
VGYQNEVLADTPILYWRLNDSSGAAADTSGNSHPGTYTGSPTLSAAGPLNEGGTASVTFNGTSQYVTLAHTAALNVADVLTLECWYKGTASGTNRALIAKGTSSYYLDVEASKLTLIKAGVGNIVASTVNVNDNLWHHCVATKNGSTVKLYVDGADVTGAVSNQTMADSTDPFNVAVRSPVASGEYITGSIAEVALYSTALSLARVQAHYNAGIGLFMRPPRVSSAAVQRAASF